ncbi:MAG TPA: cysteine dioxygenase family protein [Thermomicrobiales bacterium]|nr:cysteine dioxygenase family protein [Thermomicrobiales bacterium]
MAEGDGVAGEYVIDVPRMRQFIEAVNKIRAASNDPHDIITAIRPHFAELLADKDWLPARYQEPFEGSGMGSGIGMWLLYRASDGSLAFSSLVVPPGQQTPVHDHLAWGLVGLYRGKQDEDVFARRDDGADAERAELDLVQQHQLTPGDFYELLPENDIHRVRTTSPETSVSLHLLGNDNGCIWRHRYHPDESRVEPFRSGYVNIDCEKIAGAGTQEKA